MLPLWRDEIHVWLAPQEVSLRRMRRGVRPRCVLEARRATVSTQFDWQPALAALYECLGEAGWRSANTRVTLSNLWARYAIVPWSDALANEHEHLAHARIRLAEAYGVLGEDWRVCLSDGAPGETRIACAAPDKLLTALQQTLDSQHTRLLGVQPSLIAAYNRWRHRLPELTGWLVTIEEGALAAARLIPGGWDRVYTARIGADWELELSRLKTFARTAAQHGDSGRVFVDAPARLRKLAGACDAGIEWLESIEEAETSPVVELAPRTQVQP